MANNLKPVSVDAILTDSSTLGRRSQESSARTQETILDEAEKLFSRLGLGVSVREIAKASGVRHHTIQYHFGDKESLYKAVLNRWDTHLEALLIAAIEDKQNLAEMIDASVEAVFDFMLSHRNWVSLTAKGAIGFNLGDEELQQQGWVQFIETSFDQKELGDLNLDVGLLLITVEGIIHNHILAEKHYQTLFGKDVTDPNLKHKTKVHIQTVVRALLGVEKLGVNND